MSARIVVGKTPVRTQIQRTILRRVFDETGFYYQFETHLNNLCGTEPEDNETALLFEEW
jgi:hypothetical protein